MKRLTTFCAAVMMAAMSFAAVEYVLPTGAVTNDYGWMTVQDMYSGMNADYNTFSGASKTWADLSTLVGNPTGAGSFAASVSADPTPFFTDDNYAAKWGWMKTYIEQVFREYWSASRDDVNESTALTTVQWRWNISHFYVAGPGTPSSFYQGAADFSIAGLPATWQPAWKHGFDNPTEVAEGETWTLNAPYLEGESFRGWFDNEAGSGTPVTEITSATTGKLYACFGEYIPSIKEVRAMEVGTETKTQGTVTYVGGKNIYIADGGVGILLYFTANVNTLDGWKDLKVTDRITISGKYTVYKTFPEMTNCTLVSAFPGTAEAVTTTTLAAIVANPQAFYGTPVQVLGVKVSKYDNYGNVYVTDGTNEIEGYFMTPDQTAIPVGTKVNITAVVANHNEDVQFVGNTEDVVVAAAAGKDTYEYPVRGAEDDFAGYTLKNEWIFANTYDNYADNAPAATDMSRGMAEKDGIMYFVNRTIGGFTRVDGKTGMMLDALKITGDHLFEVQGEDGEWSACVTLAYNDVKIDNAGHLLIGACVVNTNRFQIYKVDETTGAATEVINERLYDNVDAGYDKIAYRFDAFGVYGDVDADAVIMASNSQGLNVCRWVITNGVAGKGEWIDLIADETVNSPWVKVDGDDVTWTLTSQGAPQIFPLDNGMFYVDMFTALPMLFDEEGALLDDLHNNPSGTKIGNNEGDTCKLGYGPNGLCEFQVGDEYFLAIVASNTDGTPNTAFALYKYKDAAKSFAEMEPLWYFPTNGMGAASNQGRACVPYVEVNGTTATIYLYAVNNGYAVYTFTGKEGENTAVENIKADEVSAKKVLENGVIYIYRNGVKYNVMGAQVK